MRHPAILPRLALSVAPLLAAVCPAAAQDDGAPPDPLGLRGQWSQFASSVVAGDGEGATRYGGRLDGYARIDGEAAGIADGLAINLHAEFVYGRSINRVGSKTLLPVNAAMNFPANDQEAFDLSINLVQRIGKLRLQLGKIDLFDASSAIPIVAGGGKEGFQHIGLAAPPGLIASPKVLGAIVSAPVGRVVLNIGVWQPDDWTRDYWPHGLFEDGTNGMIAGVLPTRIGGKRGFHTLTLFLSSRRPRRDGFPDIRPPDGTAPLLPDYRSGAHLRYAVQQYLWQDPLDPTRGGGFFGHIGVSVGSPAILDWSLTAGIAGNVPFRGRPKDKFGLGYFRFSLADRIVDGLRSSLPLSDEQGVEAYYTLQVGRAVRVSLSGQIVDPVLARAPNAVNLNLRAVADF